ncbi:MAG: choice-of-anchor Q domain-containing protein [Isosphaeraceae bacterium]
MSARKRFRRPVGSRLQRRSVLPMLEDLESRLVLSQNGLAGSALGPPASGPPGPVVPPAPPASKPVGVTSQTGLLARPASSILNTPPYVLKTVLGPDGKFEPLQSPAPVGYTPAQVRGAYGVNLLNFGSIVGDGAGQTIAVIDAGDNTGFQDTGPNFQGSSLQVFDQTLGLPDPPSFQKFNELGGTTLPAPVAGWGIEIALDVEWAHSIAPMANIDLVEGNTATNTDLYTAMETAGTTLHASVISMSFGAFLEYFGDGAEEPQIDSQYIEPTLAANPNLTLLASTGDDGSDFGPAYPSISPYVTGVGGTSLVIGSKNNWVAETGWSGSGGGISSVYSEPPYQNSAKPPLGTGYDVRTTPDVSAIADPNTGVAVYDTGDFTAPDAWIEVGGTSLASPVWAGIIALADQGRSLIGLPALNGPDQTLPALYGLYADPTTYAADFHDITVGNSGLYSAGIGYDLVTGIGAPIVNKLVPDLVDYGAAKSATIEFEPPADVIAGGFFGTAVQALDSSGNVVTSYEGNATISLVSGPAGANFTPQTVQFSSGVALFNSLSLNQVSQSTPYVFQIVVASQAGTLDTVVTDPVYVTTKATAGVAAYYPVPLDQSLRADIGSTQDDSQATNDIYLVYSSPFPIVDGQILLQNPVPSEPKVLNFLGQGQSASIITSNYTNRLFEITGTNGSNPSLTVVFQALTLTGGLATDEANLPLPGILSLGGALLMNGGVAMLSDVAVKSNVALGQTGSAGTAGTFAGPGGPGTNGGVAQGGGIYLAAGSLTLTDDTITGNVAQGGLGGVGGVGGRAAFTFPGNTSFSFPISRSGGQGGNGGRGGTAAGGAMYVAGGSLTINGGTVVANTAQGGLGGTGGKGGQGGTAQRRGGLGGLGGAGAAAAGGAIYLARGSVTVNSVVVEANIAAGGPGGPGGAGGEGGGHGRGPSGGGGVGGKGAAASGGGLYLGSGTVTWSESVLSFGAALGGMGGANGTGIGHGQSGSGAGGGIYAAGALNLAGGVSLQNNLATSGGGIYTTGKLTVGAITLSDNSANFGGAIASASKLTVNGATFTDNSATNGGAIYDTAGLALTSGTFTGDSATNFGGALDISGPMTISGGIFSDNSAYAGGAIYTAGLATITGASLTENTASIGGAVANASTGILTVSNQTFSSNTADDGGAIANSGTLTVSGATFTANLANILGGGLYNSLGTATVSSSTFSDNSGNVAGAASGFVGGGGIGNDGGTLILSYLTFSGNTAAGGYGGGIASEAVQGKGSVSLTYGTLSGDSAEYGGAVSNYAAMTVTNTTMSSEGAGYGGAVQNAGTLTMTNATLAENTAGNAGGGVYNNSGTLTAVNVTIAENMVDTNGAGGGLDAAGGVAVLYNTIVAANTMQGMPATPSDIFTSGTGTIGAASAYNLIGTGGSGSIQNGSKGNIVLTSLAGIGLAPAVAANGGQNATLALLAGSPAIDAGSASIAGVTVPTVDQRGAVRGPGGVNAGPKPDIGAYEASSSFLVTTNADTTSAGTLRAAIAWSDLSSNANPANLANPAPNTVVFNTASGGAFASPQTIFLTGGTLVLSNPTTGVAIAGPGASQVTISGNNAIGVVMVTAGTKATLSGITITAGSAANGGGVDNQGGNLTLMSAAVSFNTSSNDGGGIENAAGGTLSVINSQIASNSSLQGGGGISNESGGTLSLAGATISGNAAASGGGVLNQGTLSITGTTFSGNSATVGGGGLSSVSSTPVAIQSSTFTGNSAPEGGGIYATGTLTVTASMISGNSATGPGGGIASTGSLTVANTTLTGNTATGAGGGIDGLGALALNQSTVSANKAGSGGGIAIGNQATGTITDSNLTGNSATTLGGGVFNLGALTVTRSTFSTNAGPTGGAIYNSGVGALGLTNSTLANNTAATAGAGIYNLAGLTAVNTTIADNSVTAGSGGGLDAVAGIANLYNTIVALNTHGVGVTQAADDIVGSPVTVATSSAYNLVGAGGSGGIINGNNGNLVGVANPGLGPLANNGGPMQTIALLAGSPAIDAGTMSIPGITVPAGDERGAERGPAGLNAGPTVDIGAYEASSSYVVIATADTGAIGTLRTAVAWANLSTNANPANLVMPAPNTITFDSSGQFSTPQTITLSGGPISLSGTSEAESIVGLGPNMVTISGNNASGVIAVGSGVNATITGLTITGGLAAADGGGIDNAGTLTVSNLVVSGDAAVAGGGIANEASGVLSLTGNVNVTGDSALTNGGGLMNAGSLTLLHSSIAGNTASVGGGIYNSGTLSLDQTPVSGNTATTNGGGVTNTGTMAILYATLSNNQAVGTLTNPAASGGAADNSGTLTVTNSTLNSNTAATAGGGIENEATGTLTLTNATLAANSATSGGALDNKGTSFFINSTVAYNTVSGGTAGGLDLESGGRATLYNSIVALNTLVSGLSTSASDIFGFVSAASLSNMVGTGGAGGMQNNANGNLINVAKPDLGMLSNNGGPTETIALLAGSPAMDHGTASILGVSIPTTDERGAVRGPAGLNAGNAPDIGAYEASSSFVVTSPSNTLDAGTLRTAVSWADFSTNANPANIATPAPNTIVFDTTGVFSSPQTINLNGFTQSLSNPSTGLTINGPGAGIVTVSGNQAGGVFVVPSGATVALSGITITGGSATDGGGVDNSGTLSVTNATISGNSAVNGAGIDNEAGGILTVQSSTFTGNTATSDGGGIANSGTATLTNTTLAANSAAQGGGIFNAGTLTAVNVTIAYNTVTSGGSGGGLDQSKGTALLANTIIAKNTAGATASDIAGTVSSASSYNLIGTGGPGGLSSGPPGNNQVGVANPLLAPGLGNNGGPTQTIALLPNSPALDMGSSQIAGVSVPKLDQRGAVRGLTPDIGAYETSSTYLVTSTADSLNTGTLRSAVDWADSNPTAAGSGPNQILFDTTGAFATPQTITLSPNLGTLELTDTANPVVIYGSGVVSVSGNGAVGVFSVAAGVTATMQNLTITLGSADSGGGIQNSGSLLIENDTFTSNAAVYYGGAIYNVGGALDVIGSTFTNNTATFGQGGGIDNTESASGTLGTLTVSNSSFTGGVAFQGGAINNKYGTLTVTGSNLQNNAATEGGGIFNNATASVSGSTIANNVAHDGGGIANDLIGTLSVSNSTIADNSGGNNGGGLNSAGISTIVNSTIAYNSVIPGGPGGGIDVDSGTTTLYNTIVAQNTAGTGATATPNDVSGTLAPASEYNLIGSAGGGLANGVDNNIVKPAVLGLGTFGNYGGPLETVSLLSTSPAIDAGANTIVGVTIPTFDERGAVRGPAGLNAGLYVDIGSYEASSSYLVTTTADGTTAGTLREAVSWANQSTNANPINVKTPAPNTILFDTTHAFLAPETITLTSGTLALTNTTTAVAITGPSSSANAVTISGGGLSGVLSVAANVNASVSYLTITGGSADVPTGPSDGGGIDNFGTLTITDSTLSNNSAIDGGGVANELGGTLNLVASTVAANSGTAGGGIYNNGTLSVINATVANNTAALGGGIFNTGTTQINGTVLGGVLTAVNSTIAYNAALLAGQGGGIQTTTATVGLNNTIVALNTAVTLLGTAPSDISGTVATSSAYNLIGTGGAGGLTTGTDGNQVNVANPGLGTLAYNNVGTAGTTQTIALLAGSPAIGKGSSTIVGVTVPTTDQRGVARPKTTVDIGAYQYSTAVTIPPINPQKTGTTSSSSSATSSKLVVGSKTTKPSAGSAAKLHAAAKSKPAHQALAVKKVVKVVKGGK